MENRISERENAIDLMKVIAIFLVIFYHGNNMTGSLMHSEILLLSLSSTCVPLFFFVNGYLLFNKAFSLKTHMQKTLNMVILTVVWVIIMMLMAALISGEGFSLKDSLSAVLNWKQSYINHLWFLPALICIYLVFPLLKNTFDTDRRIFRYFTVVVCIFTFGRTLVTEVFSVILYMFGKDASFRQYEFFSMFDPFHGIKGYSWGYFCIGGIAYRYKEYLLSIGARKRNLFAAVLLAINCLLLSGLYLFFNRMAGIEWDVVWDGYDTVFTLINVVCIYVLCLNYKGHVRIIKSISCNTLGIYLIHVFVMAAVLFSMKLPLAFDNAYSGMPDVAVSWPVKLILSFGVLLISWLAVLGLKRIPVVKKLISL